MIDVSMINIDEFKIYYNNHSSNSTKNFFNLTDGKLNKLLENSNLKKHSKLENTKLTNIEKYGVENVFQTKEVKEKSENTKEALYGNKNYNNSNSRESTCLIKYGSKSASGNKDVQNKIKATNLERYGVDNPFKDVKKIQQSYIDNYGSIENFYNHNIESMHNTIKSKYGVTNVSQIKENRELTNQHMTETCQSKYGVAYACLLPQCKFTGRSSNSKPNLEFANKLDYNNLKYVQEYSLGKYSYDFKVDNVLIEINPYETHNVLWSPYGVDNIKDTMYHYDKTKFAKDNGYKCINVWDWDNQDIIIKLLLDRPTVYARNCIIKQIDKSTAQVFIDNNHLQGYAKDSIRYGLYYDNILVSVMTFDTPRYNRNYEYELIRYCSIYNVIGGYEKLYAHFKFDYNPKSVISYCDLSKFLGNMYEKLGMNLIRTSVGVHWYNPKTGEHITDNLLRKYGFDNLFGNVYGKFGKGSSNEDLMIKFGFIKLCDAGQASYGVKY